MKKLFLLFSFGLVSFPGLAQIEANIAEDFLIGEWKVIPSFSKLSPLFETHNFELKELNFDKKQTRRKVDMIALMEERRRYENREVEIENPFRSATKKEEGTIGISENINFHARSYNDRFSPGELENSALREARRGSFHSPYNYNFRRSYYSPYSYSPYRYSPFLR